MKRNIRQIPGQATLFKLLKQDPIQANNESGQEETKQNSQDLACDPLVISRSDTNVASPSPPSSSSVSFSASSSEPSRTVTSSLGARFLDIGSLDTKCRLRMPDSKKYAVLTTRFEPHRGWVAPLREFGKKAASRRVPDFVFEQEKHPYLRYSPLLDGVFCAPCFAFNATENVLVARPLIDWSNAKKVVDGHTRSEEHMDSITRADHFVRICRKEEQNVVEFGSTAYRQKVQKNREALAAIIEAIILCGQQNIALRGKIKSRSNITALLNYRAKADASLKEHMTSAPKHAQYTSPEIQNEFISLCGKQIASSITQRCQNAKYFTVMADESADVSDTEQFAFCVRYVDRKSSGDHVVREEFLSFVVAESTTGEALTTLLTEEIRKHDLDPELVVGQGYDGAGNMAGRIRGVQARFAEAYPHAKYVHCRNHRLNLAICHACRVAFVQSMFTTVGDILFFLTNSPKRIAIYQQHSDNGEKLRKLCPTRWSQHSESVSAFYKNFSAIADTLTDLQVGMDTNTMSTASALQKAMMSFDFVISLCVVSGPLDFLNPLSDSMQDPNCDLVKASDHALSIHGLLGEKRSSIDYFNQLWQKSVELADQQNIPVGRPRVAARQVHRNNIPADTLEDYWRLNLYLPFMDHLLTELEDRLCNALPRMKAQYLLSHKIAQLTPEIMEDIRNEYANFIDMDELDTELEVWRHRLSHGAVVNNLVEGVDATYQLLPNIHIIFKILLTMPVSTATAERSFSSLRRLKTYLRSTMSEQRLSGLALMHIHRSHTIDIDKVLSDFDASGHRRIAIVFDNARRDESSDDE